jgi:hypothetical protein
LYLEDLLLVKNGTADFGNPRFINSSPRTVVIKNTENISYSSSSGAGTVFMESVNYGPYTFTNQTAYLRHLDPEVGPAETHVTVSGGQVWILGLKTESRDSSTTTGQGSTILSVSNGANVEVLGAGIYEARPISSPPMMSLTNSSMSISGIMTGISSGSDYDQWFEETRSTTTKYLYRSGYSTGPNCYPRNTGSALPLYIGY